MITLPQQPLSINAQLDVENFTNEQLQNMEHFRISLGNEQPPTATPPAEQIALENKDYTDSESIPSRHSRRSTRSAPFMGFNFRIPRKKKKQHNEKPVFVVPITAGKGKPSINAPVYGGPNTKPSEINIKPHFPFQLLFVMTVNKSKGQTMPNVILALSKREGGRFNYTFRHLYVACSRVKKRRDNRLLLCGRRH